MKTDSIRPVRRFEDSDTFLMHWSGGLKAAQHSGNRWQLVPLRHNSQPSAVGFYTKQELGDLLGPLGYRFIAFQEINWRNGEHFSHWRPIIKGEQNFAIGPSDLWGNVSGHLARARISSVRRDEKLTNAEWERLMDASGEAERLASSIQVSLRNLDASVDQISEFYHQELINQIAASNLEGKGIGTARDQALYATVQSFFTFFGAVRDHLATFIAVQIGKDASKIDSMNRLLDSIRDKDVAASPMLAVLNRQGVITPAGPPSTKWKAKGWLERGTSLRNEFVHSRAYGQKAAEQMGRVREVRSAEGLFRYHRQIVFGESGGDTDVLDTILDCYEGLNALIHGCARASGYDTSIRTFTDSEVISATKRGL